MLLSRWFDANRGKAMGFAYLGIGVGGTLVPLIATALTTRFGWRAALQLLGVLMIVVALPMAWFVKDSPRRVAATPAAATPPMLAGAAAACRGRVTILRISAAFYLLLIGCMCSIGAVGGTMQNLKLFLSLDVKLAQGEVAQIAVAGALSAASSAAC